MVVLISNGAVKAEDQLALVGQPSEEGLARSAPAPGASPAPARAGISVAELIQLMPLAKSNAEADRIAQRAVQQSPTLAELIALAKLARTVSSMNRIATAGIALAKTVDECIQLSQALHASPCSAEGWRVEVDRPLLAGKAFARTTTDALKLVDVSSQLSTRADLLKTGVGLATALDDIEKLEAKATTQPMKTEIVVAGVRVATSAADVERLQKLLADEAVRDPVLVQYLTLHPDGIGLAEIQKLAKLVRTLKSTKMIVDRGLALATAVDDFCLLAQNIHGSPVVADGWKAECDRVVVAGIPACTAVADAIKLADVAQTNETRAKALTKGVDLATSVADVVTICGKTKVMTTTRTLALAGVRLARSPADVQSLQDLVDDDATKDAILNKYLDGAAGLR
jgi:hypothetical protein